MPPRKPEPWTGVRETIIYAGRSPQAATGARHPELATILARYLVEYFYRKLEQSRAIATCHDKTVRNFLAGIHLDATFICLN